MTADPIQSKGDAGSFQLNKEMNVYNCWLMLQLCHIADKVLAQQTCRASTYEKRDEHRRTRRRYTSKVPQSLVLYSLNADNHVGSSHDWIDVLYLHNSSFKKTLTNFHSYFGLGSFPDKSWYKTLCFFVSQFPNKVLVDLALGYQLNPFGNIPLTLGWSPKPKYILVG